VIECPIDEMNEARKLDLDDVRWELGRFGKLNIRHGKAARRKGPTQRMVPLINGATARRRPRREGEHRWAAPSVG
jgi:hypothetical protein